LQEPAIRVLAGVTFLLGDSCGTPKLLWRNADDPLKMKAKMALIREAGAQRDLCQGELAVCSQEVLRSFNTARDHILVRRQPGGCLELPGKFWPWKRPSGTLLSTGWFKYDQARAVLKVPRDLDIEAMAAVGRPGKKGDLPIAGRPAATAANG